MNQINLQVTPEFEKNLKIYMKQKGLSQKSEAIRVAVKESVEQMRQKKKKTDFLSWIGMGLKSPPASLPKLSDHDALWED